MNGNLNFAILCFSIITLTLSMISGYKELNSYGWVKTKGSIVKSEYITTRLPSQPGNSKKAYIQFLFYVDGIPYKSEKITAGLELFDGFGLWEKNILRIYPIGKSCDIYYSELNPKQASLEVGLTIKTIFLVVVGLFFVLFFQKRSNQ